MGSSTCRGGCGWDASRAPGSDVSANTWGVKADLEPVRVVALRLAIWEGRGEKGRGPTCVRPADLGPEGNEPGARDRAGSQMQAARAPPASMPSTERGAGRSGRGLMGGGAIDSRLRSGAATSSPPLSC